MQQIDLFSTSASQLKQFDSVLIRSSVALILLMSMLFIIGGLLWFWLCAIILLNVFGIQFKSRFHILYFVLFSLFFLYLLVLVWFLYTINQFPKWRSERLVNPWNRFPLCVLEENLGNVRSKSNNSTEYI